MKKIIYLCIPIIAVLSGCAVMLQPTYQPTPPPPYNDPLAYNPPPDNNQPGYSDNNNYPAYDNSPQTDQVFYDELSPYGTWIDYPDYGYVWQPNVDGDFRPYATNGYWVYSDYGWTWASGYNWGWAAFHYGRWFYDDGYGWLWLPGQEWAPAWVTWGSYGDYYCWAPIAPHVRMEDLGIHDGWNPPANSWNVVQRKRMVQRDIDRYIVRSNPAVINNVRDHIIIINNVTNNYNTNNRPGGRPVIYNRGPRVNDVENSTNIRVGVVQVSDRTKPGAPVLTNSQISVYRPAIKQIQQQDNKPAPRNIKQFRPGAGMLRPQPEQGTAPLQNNNQDNNSQPAQQGTQQPAVQVPNPYRSTNDNPQPDSRRGNNPNGGQRQNNNNQQPAQTAPASQPNSFKASTDNSQQDAQRGNTPNPNQSQNNNRQQGNQQANPAPNPFKSTPPNTAPSNPQPNPFKSAPDNQPNTQQAPNQRPNPVRNPNDNPQPSPNSNPAQNPQKNFAPRPDNPQPGQPTQQPRVNPNQGQNQQSPRTAPNSVQRPAPQPVQNNNKPKDPPPPEKKVEPVKDKTGN